MKQLFLFKSILALTLLLLCKTSNATTWYVNDDASGSNNGSSWANAFNDLQAALSISVAGDEIWVAEGSYKPGTSRSSEFTIKSDVPVYGGFNGTETAIDQRGLYYQNATILDGNIGDSAIDTDNCYHTVMMVNSIGNFYMDGFVITNGYANSGTLSGQGGGLSIQGAAQALIKNCYFNSNYSLNGGGVHVRSVANNVEFLSCIFYLNSADQGSSFSSEADLYIDSCMLVENTATDNGSIFMSSGADLTCYNATIYGDVVGSGTAQKIIDGSGTSSIFDVQNTIIWNCTQDAGDLIHVGSASSTINQCNLQSAQSNGTNIITDDPLFNNEGSLDLQLTQNSPGVNTGIAGLSFSTLDAFQSDRIQLGAIDIGAMEFDGAVQDIVYVDIDANGNGSGNSWANAQTNLRIAIEEASVGDEIWVAEGTYYPTEGSNRDEAIKLIDSLKLYGGFAGIETNRESRDPWNNKTILSGNLEDPNSIADNSYRIMLGEDLTGLIIDGFTFRDIYRESDGDFERGALYLDNCEAQVFNCEFTKNNAYANVGINCNDAILHVENCLFHNNVTTPGSVMSGLSGCDLTVIGCTFSNNIIAGGNAVIGSLSTSTLFMANTIVWQPGSITVGPTTNATAYNCILSGGEVNLTTFNNIRSEYPDFVAPNDGDFSITASSNAYDSGDPSYSTQSLDLAGNSRITDTQIDRGCFESLVCEQPHDLCINAIDLTVGATANFGSNRCATNTPDEATSCFVNNGNSVWYSFTAPASGRAEVISTWVSKFTSIFNIRHVLLEGTCGNFTVLLCDNQNSGGQGENTLYVGLTPGETYYVRVDGFNTQQGRFTIRVEEPEIPVVPGVHYVDHEATGNNDGSSWENAFTDLQDAIAAVGTNESIWIAEGTYYPTSTNNTTIKFNIPDGSNLHGGFSGDEFQLDQRVYNSNKTFLSAEIGDQNVNSDNSERFVRLGAGEVGIIIDRVTLTGAGTNTDGTMEIYNNNVLITDVEITNNYDTGNIIINAGNNTRFINCLIHDNGIAEDGGIVYSGFNTLAEFTNCTITNNARSNALSKEASGSLILYNSIVQGNNITGNFTNSGVQVFNSLIQESDDLILTDCIVNQDAQFVDSNNSDYRLTSTSPAVGLGNNTNSTHPLDYFGNTRTQNINVDAGYHESSFIRYGCSDMSSMSYDPYFEVADDNLCNTAPECPGDFDENGIVDSSDLLTFLGGMGNDYGCPYCGVDLDGNGIADSSDLLTFLANFGNACN